MHNINLILKQNYLETIEINELLKAFMINVLNKLFLKYYNF